jgi:hypothetical protein
MLLRSTPIVTRHDMWFDVSEVSNASVFGEVSKLKKLRLRTAPQSGINFTSFRSRLKTNELGSSETSKTQLHDVISQKNGVITHTAVKTSRPRSHLNSARDSLETDECAFGHGWRIKNSRRAKTETMLMYAETENRL